MTLLKMAPIFEVVQMSPNSAENCEQYEDDDTFDDCLYRVTFDV